jgi:lipid-binding SYLF domain-containing protein
MRACSEHHALWFLDFLQQGAQTFDQPVVAFVFGESGLMAGVSLEGSKISRLEE